MAEQGDGGNAGGENTPVDKGEKKPLSANIGVDFSLIGTKLHAVYEKNGSDGYAVLLMPSEQTAEKGVSVGEVISDIQTLVSNMGGNASDDELKKSLHSGVEGLGQDKSALEKLIIKLQMAFLYIRKAGKKESTVEYAFQLQVTSKDVIPKEIKDLVTIDNVSISVWNTENPKVIREMALGTINDYLEATGQPLLSEKQGD